LFAAVKNVPGVAGAMTKLRSIIGYFEKSTQATTKLLDFHRNSGINEYKDQQPKSCSKMLSQGGGPHFVVFGVLGF
jgi:hypothetical protein